MRFQAGQLLGEYKIVRPLGRGGLGAVYEATHLISQRSEALKVLLAESTDAPGTAERFRREIQLLASLNHPNISGLHNAFYHEQQLVMVMELVKGEDLRTKARSGPIPVTELVGYTAQVLAGLEYAHSRGVVHRDIKPANIMVTPSGTAKLLDFGIAVAGQAHDLTVAGSLVGSPTQISPEQIRGEKATPQSDLYSLGVTLYELIAGEPPLQGASTFDLLTAHTQQVPRPLREVAPDIPVALSNTIARALEKDPARRHRSASEFLAELNALNAQELTRSYTTMTMSRDAGLGTDHIRPSTTSLQAAPDGLVKHLAAFIGPIARVVVARLARQTTDLDQLYALAAKQIENEADRQKFLRTRPRSG